MTIYSTKVSAHYIARRAAAQAGGDPVDFLSGTLIVGDGNGSVPAISALVTHGGVLHEVWRGNVVVAVTVDEDSAAQVDVRCVIPASAGSPPVEIGPFWVREFVITDETGAACVYGTTAVQKTTSAEGQVSDLAIIAAIGESDSSVVILSPPGSNFATLVDVQNSINAHQPTAEEPLYKVDTTSPSGWLQRLFKIRRAGPAQIGVERPATNAEFLAGAPAEGASPYPWATLQQLKSALSFHADRGEWFFTPESETTYQRDLTFTPSSAGIVIAFSWWNISSGQLPWGVNPGSDNAGTEHSVKINGVVKQADNTSVPSHEFGTASVPAGEVVTVTSFMHTPITSSEFPPISQHLAYLFLPSLAS